MKVTILNPKWTIFEDEAKSVFLPGEAGEFEVLDFHKPIISLLTKGDIVVDATKTIPISQGIVKTHDNQLVALVEE